MREIGAVASILVISLCLCPIDVSATRAEFIDNASVRMRDGVCLSARVYNACCLEVLLSAGAKVVLEGWIFNDEKRMRSK